MIRWRVQTVADHPDLTALQPPSGLLTPEELAHYAALHMPQRRRDWLVARYAAKILVQQHTQATRGFYPACDTFAITQTTTGAPVITTSHPAHPAHPALCGTDGRVPLALAISHSQGYAVAALSADPLDQVCVGADIELVEPRAATFVPEFFTAAEQAAIAAAAPSLRDLLITATWSVKEAVLKATHYGLRVDPCAVECIVAGHAAHHWQPLRVSIQPALRGQVAPRAPLRAWWRTLDNRLRPGTRFVLTLAAFGATL